MVRDRLRLDVGSQVLTLERSMELISEKGNRYRDKVHRPSLFVPLIYHKETGLLDKIERSVNESSRKWSLPHALC